MKHGARNDIRGEVVEVIRDGGVMGLTKVKISGEFILSSVMTQESIDALDLAVGDEVRVIAKAVNVLVVKDE